MAPYFCLRIYCMPYNERKLNKMKIEIKIKKWRVLPDYKNGDALEKLCLENGIPLAARIIDGNIEYVIFSTKKDWLKIIFKMANK